MGKTNNKKTQRNDSSEKTSDHPSPVKFSSARRRSGSNLVGKFTQSVKRIVQEVKEEGVPADGNTRDEAIYTNQRLRGVRNFLDKAYETASKGLLGLHQKYYSSKQTINIFSRYQLFKIMIKAVVKLETEYWHLLDFPKQEKQETVLDYVFRTCSIFEKSLSLSQRDDKRARISEEEQRKMDNAERLHGMTTSQILEESQTLTNEVYRQLRKYSSLRSLITELKDDYVDSKMYPIIPRYFMLKDMIRDVLSDSAFLEICNEVNLPSHPPPANHSALSSAVS